MTRWEALGALCAAALGAVLFGQPLLALLFAPLGAFLTHRVRGSIQGRAERRYLQQFLDFLQVFSMASGVGRCGRDAFAYCYRELCLIHAPKESFLADLDAVLRLCAMDQDITEVFRTHAFSRPREEIALFGQMLSLCAKKGGDTGRVVSLCAARLGERVRLEREKEVLLARQRFELDVVLFMPAVMLVVMQRMNPGYLDTLSSSGAGVAVLVLAALLMGAAVFWGVALCAHER